MTYLIEQMIDEVIEKEGGFVDHEEDRGGPTKFGITQRTLSKWFGRKVTGSDVLNLKKETAKGIYRQNYYYIPMINELPFEIQPVVFDSAVNHGPKRAIKFVQKVINKAGFSVLEEDGIMGSHTRVAAFKADESMGPYFNNAIVDERINFYLRIVENDRSQRVFLKGWLKRAESFRKDI